MNLREIINELHWEPYERREMHSALDMYERYSKFLEIAITKKIAQTKLRCSPKMEKYLAHTYSPNLLPFCSPEICVGDIIEYEMVVFNLNTLLKMIAPVIQKHMENNRYPMSMYRIVIGPELHQAITRGKLPDTQHEFGVEPYFNIVYCPDIRGIAVLP